MLISLLSDNSPPGSVIYDTMEYTVIQLWEFLFHFCISTLTFSMSTHKQGQRHVFMSYVIFGNLKAAFKISSHHALHFRQITQTFFFLNKYQMNNIISAILINNLRLTYPI